MIFREGEILEYIVIINSLYPDNNYESIRFDENRRKEAYQTFLDEINIALNEKDERVITFRVVDSSLTIDEMEKIPDWKWSRTLFRGSFDLLIFN